MQKCSAGPKEGPTKSSLERQECEVRECASAAAEKYQAMACSEQCNNNSWGAVKDEVGRGGK